jgi:ABC-type transport system substrate-binding protein
MRDTCFSFELDARPADLRPTRQVDYASRVISAFTSASLLRLDEWDSAFQPGLVIAATPYERGQVWRLRTRPGNLWSSGRLMTTREVARSLARPKSDPLGESMRSAISRVCVEDDEIVVNLNQPLACFPAMLAADAFSPAPDSKSDAAEASGPYTLMGGVDGRTYGLTRNAVGSMTWPDGPDNILFVVSDDPYQGVRLFKRGLIDVTSNPNLPSELIADYRNTRFLRDRDLLMAGVLLCAPALRGPATRDLRRWIYAAVSREHIAFMSNGALSPLYDLVEMWGGTTSPHSLEGPRNQILPFERERPLTIAYADFEPNGAVVQQIAEDLASKLCIFVKPKALSYGDYLACLAKPDCDFIYSLIQPPFNDPTSLLTSISRFSSLDGQLPAASGAIQEAKSTFDPQGRLEQSHAAARLLMHDMPIIPIVRARTRCLVSARGEALELGADGVFRPPLKWMAEAA